MPQQMNLVKRLRLEKDLSLREMAEQSGIAAATLNRLENGGKAFERTIFKLANYFGIPFDDLRDFVAVSPKENRQMKINLLPVIA